MEPRYLELASELCDLAHKPDLFALLDLPEEASAEECATALAAFRRKMQGMQANPKWRDTARFAIKHHKDCRPNHIIFPFWNTGWRLTRCR